jgi:hypothetical protein
MERARVPFGSPPQAGAGSFPRQLGLTLGVL